MKNQLPKFYETFIPILRILSDGKILPMSDLRKRVRDEFYSDIEPHLLELKTKGGQQLLLNRIGWGKSYLKQAKMVESPSRGQVCISEKGRKILAKGSLSLKELQSDADYMAYEKITKAEKISQTVDADSSPQDLIDSGFQSIEQQVKAELLEQLKNTNPYYFQKVVLTLLEKMGYGVPTETPKSNDEGIDGIITQDKLGLDKIYMQAKRYTENQVGGRDMTNFIGALSRDKVSRGIFVTTTTFSNSAVENASRTRDNIILIDGNMLADLMLKYSIGVQVKNIYEVKEIDEDFFEEE